MRYQHKVTVRGPIDMWSGWQWVHDLLLREPETEPDGLVPTDLMERMVMAWSSAVKRSPIDTSGSWRHGPLVTGTPGGDDGYAHLMFGFKMDANGTTILVEEVDHE